MSDQEMKDIWLGTGGGKNIKLDLAELEVNLRSRMKKLDRTLFFRDSREIIAAILVMIVFGYKSVFDSAIITKITSVLFVVWAGYIIYRLLDVRKYKKVIDLSASFKNQLLQQKHYLEQQAHLLDSIFSWYLGPFAVIITIRVIGSAYGDPFWVFMTSIGLVLPIIYLLSWGIYALNKRAAKPVYPPLIENIDNVLSQLDKDTV